MVAAATIAKMLNMEIAWQGVSDCADVKYADYITSKLPSLDPERDAVVVHYIHAMSDACRKALDRGLGVFASNCDDYTVPEYQRNRLSYVGQDEYQAGRVNALYITQQGLLKKADRVVICVPQRGIEAHERRAQGLQSVLETETGCVVDYISGWGSEIAKIPEQLAAYYRGHPDVKAFFAVEGGLGQGFEAFMRSVNLAPGSMPNVMWDTTEPAMKSIKDGYITGTDDQQFYLQGFLPPVIIWLWKNAFTHFMAPISINVGATIVDKSNVDVFEKFQAACVEQVKALGWFKF
jgi:simple sugar transport system substrate-binding protein